MGNSAAMADEFNKSTSSFGDDFWLHALLIIPIEFGILHSTPLGPMLSVFFHDLWAGIGFEFATSATTAATGAVEAVQSAAEAVGSFCHLHGTEMVCH